MEILIVVVLVAFAVAVVASPLRAGRTAESEAAERADLDALEAARDAKYREIRELELDYRTGKLSDADWRRQDRQLRREAVEILRRMDVLGVLVDGPEAPSAVAAVPAGTREARHTTADASSR